MNASNWSSWLGPLVWTLATVAATWGLGWLLAMVLRARVRRAAGRAPHMWVRLTADLIWPQLPWWGLLLGLWLATGYWPLTPQALVLVQQGSFVLIAGSMTIIGAKVATRIVDSYGATVTTALPVTSLTKNIAWAATITVGTLVILNGLGLSIAPMLAALGVGGLAVALALQEPLANFFAGVFVTLARQIRVGDYVKLDSGHEGYVIDFSWRSTRLRMLANNVVVVPNAKLAQATVINHHLPSADLAVLVEVGVEYGSDLGHVERVVTDVGRQVMHDVDGGVVAFEPFIRYHTFADSSVNFTVILRASEFVDQYLIKHEFIKRLHTKFGEEGIVIPFPIRTVVHREVLGAGPQRDRDGVAGAA